MTRGSAPRSSEHASWLRRCGTAVVVAALAGLASCGSAPAWDPGSVVRYVAIGDSYTSGPGIEPVEDPGCLRSRNNYPRLVAAALHAKDFVDASCGGATTDDLRARQVTSTGANAPQMTALDRQTDLVTVGIGLNDDGLATYLLYSCVRLQGQPAPPACRALLSQPESVVLAGLSKLESRVTDAIVSIRKQAPHARVVLVGYPQVFPRHGSCPDRYPVDPSDLVALRALSERIERTYQAVARDLHVDFVDMWRRSEGHDICAPDPWIRSAVVPEDEGPLHPLAPYHRAVADQILRLLRAS